MKIENAKIEFKGDDIWINGDLISKCGGDEWWAFLDDEQKEFDTLEEAAKYCLEKAND
ncbi:conserved hypothetical protein [Acinetobacter proteolyticus]|uniref:Uncharacterized protein n=1 Tax=Acinetobacter proteolyticus TaxID=1776741 RepID=A0A653KB61_9GAMM|nr:hypothetical protein [Acinetobacter proteolyticus]VXA58240.1 conserved hypothetical protein [Acinetobacter proteolyticus]